MAISSRRLMLRLGVKLMLFSAAAAVLYVLLSSIDKPDDAGQAANIAPLRIPIPEPSTPNPQRVVWAGGNIILIRRDAALLAALQHHTKRLHDPDSRSARQPPAISGPGRALRPELFIAYDRGTDMGCPLRWVPAGHPAAPLQPWPGGFRDNCRGSWYDAAGRVLSGQEAKRNLDIPPYRYLAGGLLEIGGSGDNAAPAR